MADIALARLTGEPLDIGELVDAVHRDRFGAVSTFIGTVRDHDPDVAGEVTALEYSAHPDAERILTEVCHRVAARYDDVALAVAHRVGLVPLGGTAIVAAAASAHRPPAFEACRELVAAVKAEVPLWKRQLLADGTHTWVGL